MPRKFLKRWTPDPSRIRNIRGLGFLGRILEDQHLFHLNRHSVSTAVFIGLFTCFLPMPGQMAVGAMAALVARGNLPITIALIWLSNPVTMPIMFFSAYQLGAWLLGARHQPFNFEVSWQWFATGLPAIWQPLLLGSVVCGLFFGSLGYLLVHWVWRWHVADRWKQRRQKRLQAKMDRERL